MTPLDYPCPHGGCGAKVGNICDWSNCDEHCSVDYYLWSHPERIAVAEAAEKEKV